MTDNQATWDDASLKHVREYDELLRAAATYTFALLAEHIRGAVSIRPGPVRSDGVRRERRTTGHEGVEP